MITLRDILKLNPFLTLLELDVRDPESRLLKRVIIGKDYRLSSHQLDDERRDKLEYIDADINKHGRVDKRGFSEIAFSMDWKAIPKKYLDAEVTDIGWIHERYGNVKGSVLDCTIVPIQLDMDCAWK